MFTPTPELNSPSPTPSSVISPIIDPTPSPEFDTPSPPKPISESLNLPSPNLTPEIDVSPSPETSPLEVEIPTPSPLVKPEEVDIPFFGQGKPLDKKSFLGNIKHTIKKYKVINLAIGIIIASFVSEGVYFLVDDIIMKYSYPLITELVGERSHINLGLFKLDLKQVLRTMIRTIVFTLVLFTVIKISEHLDLL